MDIKTFNRLAIIGVAAIGIGNAIYHMDKPGDALEIQKQAIMDIQDITKLEDEIQERRRKGNRELYFKNYKIIIRDR